MKTRLSEYLNAVRETTLTQETGRVLDCNGLVIEASGPDASLGELCHVYTRDSAAPVLCEVTGFKNDRVLLMPYGDIRGISRQSEVSRLHRSMDVPVGEALLGRVVDAFCEPLDGRGPVHQTVRRTRNNAPVNPLSRMPISTPFETGVRAIDCLLTMGKGQRMGVFAGSGVGKSTVLGMMARNMSADINVIALIGERGREVWDFIIDSLGAEGMKRSVVVVATADQPALARIHAVHAATTIAESFRDLGKDVLFMMDSVTRYAMAQREIGLATGEPPTLRGYTPSVFAVLPQLLERCGRFESGSITAVYSVLVEGDDMNEPVSDHMRAVLDGHIVLSRDLAARGHYPAIDVTHSVSRLLGAVSDPGERIVAKRAVEIIARVEAARDLIDMGAYHAGSNAELDAALSRIKPLTSLLIQDAHESTPRSDAMQELSQICADAPGATVSGMAA